MTDVVPSSVQRYYATDVACISQHLGLPVGSKPALPPGRVNPWRSCAATKTAAGKRISNRGDRGSIAGGRYTVVQSWENFSKQMK